MLAGGRFETTCEGGVCERVLSLMPLPIPNNGSGDRESKSACGTVFPNSSLRKTREYMRFASSATLGLATVIGNARITADATHSFESEAPNVEHAFSTLTVSKGSRPHEAG